MPREKEENNVIDQPITTNPQPVTRNSQPVTRNPKPAAGLYIHIPFCLQKCPYCDFYSATDLALIPDYLDSLRKEMQAVSQHRLVFDTVYLGGGTPSVMTPEQIAGILENLFQRFRIAANSEITIEVNPGTVTRNQLREYRQAGIQRINIGAQSFNAKILAFLKRIHSVEDSTRAIQHARDAGFENLGVDLIYGVPGQNKHTWRQNLQTAVSLSPEHLSCYMLSYEKGTPMERELQNNRFSPLADGIVADLFELTHTLLSNAGYDHYEISNFAKKKDPATGFQTTKFRSRHNQKYWTFAPYIGLGPSAHSYIGKTRSWNYADLKHYIACLNESSLPIQDQEVLTEKQQMIEAVYLGLRTARGIDIPWFEETFHVEFNHLFAGILPDMTADECLILSGNRCALTLKGMLLVDSIAQRLIGEIPGIGVKSAHGS